MTNVALIDVSVVAVVVGVLDVVTLRLLLFFLGSISSIFAREFFARTRFDAFFGEWCSANGAQIWQISAHILGKFSCAKYW